VNGQPLDLAGRAFRDIAASERQMREQAENTVREFARLLAAVANHFAGQALEERRTNDPEAPYNWSLMQWNTFFTQHIFLMRSAWGQVNLPTVQIQELETENRSLKAENKRLQKALEAYRQTQGMNERLASPPVHFTRNEPIEARTSRAALVGLPGLPAPLPAELPVRDEPVSHTELLDILRGWKTASIPDPYSTLFKDVSEERWTRQTITLYLLAAAGICARPEIEQLLAMAANVDRRTTAIRQAVDYLVQVGLVSFHRLEMRQPLETSLVVLQLTASGLDLCRLLGWQAVEPEVQRFRRLLHLDGSAAPGQAERVLSVLSFAFQARLRGYKALVAPSPVEAVQPDVYVEREAEHYYVFVENGSADLYTRWLSGDNLPFPSAVCGLDEPGRLHIAAQCKAVDRPAAATDLAALVHERQPGTETPLWTEKW